MPSENAASANGIDHENADDFKLLLCVYGHVTEAIFDENLIDRHGEIKVEEEAPPMIVTVELRNGKVLVTAADGPVSVVIRDYDNAGDGAEFIETSFDFGVVAS